MEIVRVPAFDHSHIDSEPLNPVGAPIPYEWQGEKVPLVVSHDATLDSPLRQISGIHGRSYEVTSPDAEVWTDEYGNPYTSLSSKGNNLTRPDLMRSATAPSGFLPYGLQESDALLRVVRASRIMREAGVDTEWPLRYLQPKSLVFEGDVLSVGEYKARLISRLLDKVQTEESFDDNRAEALEELSEASKVIVEMDFFVTLRSTSVGQRIGDIFNDGDANSVGINPDALIKVFQAFNMVAPHRAQEFAELGLTTDLPTRREDLDREALEYYFVDVLPKLAALNLAKMRNVGLVHTFPHYNNFNGLGGLVDLDSVRGKKLDPELHAPRELRYIDDGLYAEGVFDVISSDGRGYDVQWDDVSQEGKRRFIRTYLARMEKPLKPGNQARFVIASMRRVLPNGIYATGKLDFRFLDEFYGDTARAYVNAYLKGREHFGDDNPKLEAKELAEHLVWASGSVHGVWDYFSTLKENSDGFMIYNAGKPPTNEQLIEQLPIEMGANKDRNMIFSEAIHQVCVRPRLSEEVIQRQAESVTIAYRDFLRTISPDTTFSQTDMSRYFRTLVRELQMALEVPIDLPAFDEFWTEMKRAFNEKCLDTIDRAVIPANMPVTDPDNLLEEYIAGWEYIRRPERSAVPPQDIEALMHICAHVPAEYVDAMVDTETLPPVEVATEAELLQVVLEDDEFVRAVVTDGNINDYINHPDYYDDDDNPDADYMQFKRAGDLPTNGTWGIIITQTGRGNHRVFYKTLKQSN